jgi:hypothetical protein
VFGPTRPHEDTFQLFDLVSDGKLPDGFMMTNSAGRIRWGAWAYNHFNAERENVGLDQLTSDKCEHSGCEYIRYCRECLQNGWAEYIPPKTLERLAELGYHKGPSVPPSKKQRRQ